MRTTPTAELIGIKLGEVDLGQWISQRQSEGWSYGRLAAEVFARTGVYVTAQTIRSWVATEAGAA